MPHVATHHTRAMPVVAISLWLAATCLVAASIFIPWDTPTVRGLLFLELLVVGLAVTSTNAAVQGRIRAQQESVFTVGVRLGYCRGRHRSIAELSNADRS